MSVRLSIFAKTNENRFDAFCLFLEKGGGVAATPGLLWIVLKIEICFSIIKISNNPVEGGWGSLKRSSSRPIVQE